MSTKQRKPFCCTQGCNKDADYRVEDGRDRSPEGLGFTDSCAQHLEDAMAESIPMIEFMEEHHAEEWKQVKDSPWWVVRPVSRTAPAEQRGEGDSSNG